MFGLFKPKSENKPEPPARQLLADLHNHLLPGIDDGAQNIDESIELILGLKKLGYVRAIATPHVMLDYYRNTPETILPALDNLKKALAENHIEFGLEASAEYYIDEYFLDYLEKGGALLPFNQRYILIETGFMNKPMLLDTVIKRLKDLDLTPVMAHPERYLYWQANPTDILQYVAMGVVMCINLMSITGYYGPAAEKIAKNLIEQNMVRFVASDIHKAKHLPVLNNALTHKFFTKYSLSTFQNSMLRC